MLFVGAMDTVVGTIVGPKDAGAFVVGVDDVVGDSVVLLGGMVLISTSVVGSNVVGRSVVGANVVIVLVGE